jgi:pimeloyl-ACP methyl ester carboxylesterase
VKVDLAAVIASGEKFAESIMINTKLRENGKPVRLEVVIDQPPGDRRFPLLVFNHGSTGEGTDPALFAQTVSYPAFAEMFVERGYMVIDRSRGYTFDPELSLPGADRALTDIGAAVEVLRQRPDVAGQPILMAGFSRGGIPSIAYAGMHPREVTGVINFAGGWVGEGCPDASEINGTLFKRGGMFPYPTLWLYGNHDPYYGLDHSRANFAAFLRLRSAGRGRAQGDVFPAPLDRPRRSLPRLDRRDRKTAGGCGLKRHYPLVFGRLPRH